MTADPKSNGFYEAGRFKKYIPRFYRLMELKFMQKNDKIKMFEWYDPNKTFHSKGIWLENANGGSPLTVIGSSKFGVRSY